MFSALFEAEDAACFGPVRQWVLGLAYLTSITGSYVGLLCARQTTRSRGSIARAWMVMAAAAIGGVGV